MIIAFRDTRFKVPRFKDGKPAVAIDSLIITSPPGLNKFGKPDADGVYRPDWVQLSNGVVLSSVPAGYAAETAAEKKARFEQLKAQSTIVTDEDDYWLAGPGYTRYGMRPEDATPLGEPLEYYCDLPSDTPGRRFRFCRIRYYWTQDVSLAYDIDTSREPRAEWRERDQRIRQQLKSLQINQQG
jgi:hypothetical protein